MSQGRIMQRMFQGLKIKDHHFSIERAILIALGLLALWFIALMTFMENGKNHAVNLAFVSVLMVLLIGLTRALEKNKYQGYIIAFAAVMIAVIGYFRLSSFFIHTEIIFTLALIGISARWGTRQGIFAAILGMMSNGLLHLFYEQIGVDFEIFAIGGFFLASAFIVGALSKQKEAALQSRADMYEKLNRSYSETLHALVKALDMRDSETGGHSERVTQIALLIARQLKLEEKEIQEIQWGALLHDVGKIGIPDHILRKPGKLTEDEWIVMRTHPQVGYEMLEEIPFLAPSLDVVLHHHEKFDGTGYPSGLSGKAIPLAARIFAIADTFDAMTNDRPYRKAFCIEEALEEIQHCSNFQFDPEIVDAFLKAFEQARKPITNEPSNLNSI